MVGICAEENGTALAVCTTLALLFTLFVVADNIGVAFQHENPSVI